MATVDSTLSAVRARINEMVKIANKSEEIHNSVMKVIAAGETNKRGPLIVYWALLSEYGEKLKDFPIPGSKQSDGVNNPDIYRYQQAKDNGDKVWKTDSFYRNFADATTDGVNIQHVLNDIALAVKGEETDTNGAFRNMGKPERDANRKRFEAQKTLLRSVYRRAFQLHFMIEAAKEAGVGVRLATKKDKDGNIVLSNGTYPIHIYDVADPVNNFDVITVPSFLALDLQRAKDTAGPDGNIYLAFKNSGNRSGSSGAKAVERKMDIKRLESELCDIANYLDTDDGMAQLYKKLNSKDKTDHFLLAVFDLYAALTDVCHKKEYINRRERLLLAATETEPKKADNTEALREAAGL